MFGIGMTEIVLILVIALIVIGPDKLPDIAKMLGKGMAEFKKATDDFRSNLYSDIKSGEEKSVPLQKLGPPEGKDQEAEKIGKETQTHKETETFGLDIADEAPPVKRVLKDKPPNQS